MKKLILPILLLISQSVFAAGKVYSLGAGLWSPDDTAKKSGTNSVLSSFSQGKFARLTHEGLMGSNFLYVVGVGANIANVKSEYSYKGQSSTTSLNELEAKVSLVEAKLGLKYLVFEWLYFGGGALVGDFQINYERSNFIEKGGDLANYKESENINYLGHFYEAGIMLASKSFGLRFGAEINSIALQKDVETLGNVQPEINSSKLYLEILWKN